MSTIQKRADELKPGDVFEFDERRIVLAAMAHDGCIAVIHAQIGIYPKSHGEYDSMVEEGRWNPSAQFAVESPDLTPAQQHAEELADTLRKLVDSLDNGVMYHAHAAQPMKDAHALLDKIKPPEPPTLEEALKALETLHASTHPGSEPHWSYDTEASVRALLDRARRAGKL